MIKPSLDRELVLWSKGYTLIGGIDEAGRGSWAGPVVAAVVVLPKDHVQDDTITDSKLLSATKREELYSKIVGSSLLYGVGIVDHKTIDKVGILNATKMAAAAAVNSLKVSPDYLLCDALDLSSQLNTKQESIIKGDQKVYSISCASIVAKVTRDRIMVNLEQKYQKYKFAKHKGYGTKLHQEMLEIYGPSDIHRRSYAPIRRYYES